MNVFGIGRWMAALALAAAVLGCGGENVFGVGLASEGVAHGSIAGSITGDGVPFAGVRVILIERDSVESDGRGEYRFDGLPAGAYAVSIRVPLGFMIGPGDEMVRAANVVGGGVAIVDWRLNRTVTGPF